MLQLTWFELFVRLIPESFFVILAVHAFSKQKIDRNRYIISTLIYSTMVFFVGMLPISFGIHTIINVILLISINNYINKIKLSITIRSSIITLILLYICELINMFIIQYFLRVDTEKMLGNVYIKTIYSLPSLILIAVIAIISYYLVIRKKR